MYRYFNEPRSLVAALGRALGRAQGAAARPMPPVCQVVRFSAVRPAIVLASIGLGLPLGGCLSPNDVGSGRDGRPEIVLEDCILTARQAANQVDARCGTLTVPEDREAGAGRTIDVFVAVVPAVSRNPEPDPLFLLAGGPGQAATEAFPAAMFAFDRIGQDRDLVLVDQRGTGRSAPLDCARGERDLDDPTDAVDWARSCVERLSPQADLRQYTTSIAVADLDDVRAALGYERVNLFGGSYGSRVALEYLRRYPDRVRTAIIDSVLPPDLALGTTVARDAQQAIELTFSRCQADPLCRASFPTLEAEFESLLQELGEEPIEVVATHPVTGERENVDLTREMVAGVLRFMSYSPETAALVPLVIHHTIETSDYSRLAAQVLLVASSTEGSLSMGMHFSVVCAEDVPYFDAEEVALSNADSFIADMATDLYTEVCRVWPRADIPPDFKDLVTADVPVLILSGEADPVTPPRYGEAVASALPDSLHLVGRGQGHGILVRGCVSQLARAFVEGGTLDGLDPSCVDRLKAPPFFVNFSGPVVSTPTEESSGD